MSSLIEVELPSGEIEPLPAGANLALVGRLAVPCVRAVAEERTAAVLIADGEDPLAGGRAVADQIADALGGTRRAARDRATDLLELTGMPEPHLRVHARPHELSPLDRQRAQLALALANSPALVVGEDPCAGLDPAEAATFAATLHRLWSRLGFTLLLACTEPEDAQRAAEQMLVLDDSGAIRERRRRRHA